MAADIIIDKIQFKRGDKANMPILDAGEPFYTDTGELFIGSSTGNKPINNFIAKTGTTAPTINAEYVGQHYIDTVLNKVYIAKSVTANESDWIALN